LAAGRQACGFWPAIVIRFLAMFIKGAAKGTTRMIIPTSRGLSRRALIRNGLLVGFGAAAGVAALPELTGTAQAVNTDVTIDIIITGAGGLYSFQPDWWYCLKCYGLYHSDNDTAGGVCPAGGKHQNNTSYTQYCIPHDGRALSENDLLVRGVQPGWRWC